MSVEEEREKRRDLAFDKMRQRERADRIAKEEARLKPNPRTKAYWNGDKTEFSR